MVEFASKVAFSENMLKKSRKPNSSTYKKYQNPEQVYPNMSMVRQ
jgi:hypothetical protein